LAPSKGHGITITNTVTGNTDLDCFEVDGNVKCTTAIPAADEGNTSEAAFNDTGATGTRKLTASCQSQGDFCTPGYECCGGLTCQHVDGGYSHQCQPATFDCAPAGDTLEGGQECCPGSMKYQANGGAWCKALAAPQPSHTQPSQPSSEFMFQWSARSNFCMSVQQNTFRNGQTIQLWHCHEGAIGQHFQLSDASSGSLIQPSAAPGFCVVVSSNENKDGAKVQLWQCDSSILTQQWIRSDGILRNAAYPDMCLVVNGNRGYDGNKLQLWSCDGDEEFKRWNIVN